MAETRAGATREGRLGRREARALVERLNQDAARIAERFGLTDAVLANSGNFKN